MKGWLLALAVLQGADAASTCAALHRGFREGNPLLPQSCAGIVGVKAVTVVVLALGLPRLARAHPKLARGVASVAISSSGVGVVWNVRVLRGGTR